MPQSIRQMAVDAAPRPMRIGVLCSRFPLPPSRADQLTTAHLLAFLHARGHEVDLFCLSEGAAPAQELRQWVAGCCREMTVFPHSSWRCVTGALAALVRGLPLQVGWFSNRHLDAAIRRAVAERDYDVLYCYTLRSAEPLRGLGGRRTGVANTRPVTYLAMQLSQSLNTQRIAECATSWWERVIYRLEHRLIAAYESHVWQDFTRTVLIGAADVREVRRVGAQRGMPAIDNYLLSAHGVDADRYFVPTAKEAPCRLVFSGLMATNTNVGAVQWFVRNVWPTVRRQFPAAEFVIVGRRPRREILALHGRQGIAVTGEVDNPARYMASATVCVNPMQAGAGMQNKLLEFFAAGRAVVATSVANEGIGAKPGEHVLIADAPADFASAIAALLRDSALRERLGCAARAYVLAQWSWESHFLKLEADMRRQVDEVNNSAC